MKKLNLANVRSAIGATIALCAALLACAPGAAAAAAPSGQRPAEPTVRIVWLPSDTTVAELAEAGFSPGLMSAGLGTVPPEQTYLDITQGNRVFDSLYDQPLPPLAHDCPAWWRAARERADSAPAEIVPGLLASTLDAAGVGNRLRGEVACGLREARLGPFYDLSRPPDELLIAIARPTGEDDEPLAIGIAGRGFEGNLTSDSTRTDGYVLSTDVAPTILEWFGLDVPAQMSGQPIRSEAGAPDVAAIESLGARMAVISHRRGPVIGWSLLVWLGLLALAALAARLGGRPGLARAAVRLVGLAVVYMPLVMLAGAALEPGEAAETLLVMLAAPALAALTLAALRGYRALAAAAGLTVLAYAVDVVVGSPLTSLSLLGPNPGLGVRFYGIGNELEALLAVLVVAGCGAALAGFWPRLEPRRAAAAFLASGLACAFVFAAGRFGADVGAAIVLPVGAAAAAVLVGGRSRRAIVLVVAVPFAVLALLALVDLLSGANAHLTRSVLDAGGLHALGDVAQRRLQLSVHSFGRPVLLWFLPVVAALAALAVWKRDRLRAWTAGSPAYAAGLGGAVAATVVGTLANDSGALLLEIGTAYLLVFAGFAWAESDREPAH